jgi:flagellar basal-body rod protein FlgB
MSWLADPVSRALSGAISGLSVRQSLIASNLANIDTPGYVPQAIDFESALQSELAGATGDATGDVGLRTTDPRHLSLGAGMQAATGGSVGTFSGSARNDGNAVDLESEMTALAENQIRFGAVSRLESGRLGMLRDAITGGR